jgi:hypothetical protein
MVINTNDKRRPAKPRKPRAVAPQRMYPESRVNRMCTLEVGESEAASRRLEFGDVQDGETVQGELEVLRSTISKAAQVASKRSGHTYTTETGQFFTRSNDIVLVAVATRTQ